RRIGRDAAEPQQLSAGRSYFPSRSAFREPEWLKRPVARGRQSGRKRQGTRGKEGKARPKLQAFTPRRLPKPSLLRDGYIFWQRAMVVKLARVFGIKEFGWIRAG